MAPARHLAGLHIRRALAVLAALACLAEPAAAQTDSSTMETVSEAATSLQLDLTFDPESGELDGAYSLRFDALAPLSPLAGVPLDGSGQIAGEIGGKVFDPSLTADFAFTDLAVADRALGRSRGRLEVEQILEAPRGKASLHLEPPEGALDLSGAFVLERSLELSALLLTLPDGRISGDLSLPLDGTPARGRLQGRLEHLGPLLALAGAQGEGRASLELELMPVEGTQGARFQLEATQLQLLLDEDSAIGIASLSASGQARDLLGTPRGNVSARAAQLSSEEFEADEMTLRVEGDLTTARFEAATQGRLTRALIEPVTLESAGRLGYREQTLALDLERFSGRLDQRNFSLLKPTALRVAPNRLSLQDFQLAFEDGELGAAFQLTAERLDGRLSARAFPLDTLDFIAPQHDFEGELNALILLSGTPGRPEGSIELDVTGIPYGPRRKPSYAALDLTGRLTEGRLRARARLEGVAEPAPELIAELPIAFSAQPLAFAIPETRAISASMDWRGQITPLWRLLPLPEHRLSGEADIALRLGGTLASPEASGRFELSDGRYEHLEQGTILTQLALLVEGDGERILLRRLEATDGGSGRLSGEGRVSLDPDRNMPFDIALTMTAATMVRRDDITAEMDGDLRFEGDRDVALLSGSVRTRSVEIRLVDTSGPRVVDLNPIDVTPGRSGQETHQPQQTSPFIHTIRLDLTVDLPQKVFVRGRGLDSEWGGGFKIGGTANNPRISGKLEVIRGQLSFLGKLFRIKDGTVEIPQGEGIDPRIDVAAVYEETDLTVTIRAKGPVTQPEFTFASVPELPRDEIIARVLFGKETRQLSALEAAQLAAAVAELTGVTGGGPGVLDVARNILGVDVLNVQGGEEGTGTTVSAGKYVTEEVFVGVEQGSQSGSGAVSVEVEITPNISVESKVGAEGNSDVGVNFKWDY